MILPRSAVITSRQNVNHDSNQSSYRRNHIHHQRIRHDTTLTVVRTRMNADDTIWATGLLWAIGYGPPDSTHYYSEGQS